MSQRKKFEKLSEIDDANANVELHFAVQQISPLKTARSGVQYFDGYVNDGSKQMRFVGFNEDIQTKLSSMKSPVKAERCTIKRGRNQDFEIFLNSGTKISPSPRKIDFSNCVEPTEKQPRVIRFVSIGDIDSIADGEYVDTKGTVTSLLPARPVSTGLIQEATFT